MAAGGADQGGAGGLARRHAGRLAAGAVEGVGREAHEAARGFDLGFLGREAFELGFEELRRERAELAADLAAERPAEERASQLAGDRQRRLGQRAEHRADLLEHRAEAAAGQLAEEVVELGFALHRQQLFGQLGFLVSGFERIFVVFRFVGFEGAVEVVHFRAPLRAKWENSWVENPEGNQTPTSTMRPFLRYQRPDSGAPAAFRRTITLATAPPAPAAGRGQERGAHLAGGGGHRVAHGGGQRLCRAAGPRRGRRRMPASRTMRRATSNSRSSGLMPSSSRPSALPTRVPAWLPMLGAALAAEIAADGAAGRRQGLLGDRLERAAERRDEAAHALAAGHPADACSPRKWSSSCSLVTVSSSAANSISSASPKTPSPSRGPAFALRGRNRPSRARRGRFRMLRGTCLVSLPRGVVVSGSTPGDKASPVPAESAGESASWNQYLAGRTRRWRAKPASPPAGSREATFAQRPDRKRGEAANSAARGSSGRNAARSPLARTARSATATSRSSSAARFPPRCGPHGKSGSEKNRTG